MLLFLALLGFSMTVNAAFSYWQKESIPMTLFRQASAAIMLTIIAVGINAMS